MLTQARILWFNTIPLKKVYPYSQSQVREYLDKHCYYILKLYYDIYTPNSIFYDANQTTAQGFYQARVDIESLMKDQQVECSSDSYLLTYAYNPHSERFVAADRYGWLTNEWLTPSRKALSCAFYHVKETVREVPHPWGTPPTVYGIWTGNTTINADTATRVDTATRDTTFYGEPGFTTTYYVA